MIFAPDMAALVLSGRKTQTRRLVRWGDDGAPLPCRYIVGRIYAVQARRGGKALGHILILTADHVPTGPLSPDDARAEGFPSPAAFEERWRAMHPDAPGSCWRITFRRALP